MPIFQFQCQKCGKVVEVFQSYADAAPLCCLAPIPMKRIISLVAPPQMGGIEGKIRSGKAIKKRNDDHFKSPDGQAEYRGGIEAARKKGLPA